MGRAYFLLRRKSLPRSSLERSSVERGEKMFRKLHLPLFPLIFFSVLAFPQDNGRVIGQIRVVRGDFPSHAIMVELQLHGATVSSMYTDGEGRFGFYELQSNLYHVVVNDEDYYPVDEQVNLNLMESQFAMAQIQLRPREKKNADPLDKQAAGSNPYIVDPAEYDKGLESEKKGKQDAALEHYETALKLAPDYYPAHNNLGVLYLGNSDFKSAADQFREAVRLDQ